MTRTVREIAGEEMVDIFFRLTSYAFRPTPPLADEDMIKELIRRRRGARYFAAFEDQQAVACAGGHAMHQNSRGAIVPMGGVYAVAVHPAARRKGHARAMIADLLASMRADGQPYSCLYPFRESFYDRLGYATFPQPRWVKFNPGALAPLLKLDHGGQVDLCLLGEGYPDYYALVETLRTRVHGMAAFDEPNIAWASRNERWLALARVDGQVVGAAVYDIKGDDIAQFTLRCWRFLYLTAQARYLLLDWLARHIDQAARAEIWLPPDDYPETWFPDLSYKTEPGFLAPMGRVLDLPAAGGIPCGPGCFTARITDSLCPWNEGVWQFENNAGLLRIAPAAQAECDLSIQAVAALIYGVNAPADFLYRGWGNPPAPVQETMRVMFPRQTPYMFETF